MAWIEDPETGELVDDGDGPASDAEMPGLHWPGPDAADVLDEDMMVRVPGQMPYYSGL